MDGMVLPDLTKPLTKKIKEQSIMMEKLYMPFMDLYFDKGGTVTSTITFVGNKLLDRLMNLMNVMQGISTTAEDTAERERRKEKPEDEKKKSWIMERWQKIIKLGFFQKTLGFLKGLASVSFITELLTFLVLLRLGIFQRFLPLIVSVVGGAIESLVRAIPKILKFIWGMLTKTLPGILRSILHTTLKTLGLENKAFFAFADVIAKGLPMLLAMVWAFSKLGPIISGIGGFISGIGSVLAMIGVAIIKILALIGIVVSAPAWIVGAIAVAVAALIGLIWVFRKQISNFLSGIWEGLNEVFFGLIASIGEYISSAWHSIIVSPIQRIFRAMRRMADPVFKKISPIINAISSIFDTIDTKVTSMIDSIKSALDSMLDWFSDVSTFGAVDWMTMDGDKKQSFKSTRESLRQDALVQFAQGDISEEDAAKKLGRKDAKLTAEQLDEVNRMRSLQTGDFKNTDIATIMAASMEGVIDKISGKSGAQKRIVNTLTFAKNNSNTKSGQ